MATILQKSFQTGLNLLTADTNIAQDGYVWAINARNRYGYLEPRKMDELIAGAPTDFKVSGTPQCIVVQDGINQPQLITYDTENQLFTSRVSKNYNDWQNTSTNANDREYVPIGRQMMMFNQTLCMKSIDGKSMFRSVTGRPLDFMVNVDIFGNKQPSESVGGASSVAQAFDFDEITCLQVIDIPDCFVWGTRRTTRIVQADYNN